MVDERHQHGLRHLAQMASQGAEQLAFWQHDTHPQWLSQVIILGRTADACTSSLSVLACGTYAMQGQVSPFELLFVTEPQPQHLADRAVDRQAADQCHPYPGQRSQ